MGMRAKALSRRTLLRGAGVALGLPLLEAMAPRGRASAAAAREAAARSERPTCTFPTGPGWTSGCPRRQVRNSSFPLPHAP